MEDHPTIVLDIKSGYRINELAALQGNGSLISDKKKRALFSMHRPHQRSRSVGNVTVYGVGAIPSTSTVKEKTSAFTLNRSSSNRTHGSLNAIAATKRFLKMLVLIRRIIKLFLNDTLVKVNERMLFIEC